MGMKRGVANPPPICVEIGKQEQSYNKKDRKLGYQRPVSPSVADDMYNTKQTDRIPYGLQKFQELILGMKSMMTGLANKLHRRVKVTCSN